MFCSTIIATIGRNTLARAVESVLCQDLAEGELEVIVVNDSGAPLPAEDWQLSGKVRVIHTNCRERSVARNAGAAIARGDYLHFLDDDDWILPGALGLLQQTAEESPDCARLYGATRWVDDQGTVVLELNHDLEGNCSVQAISGEFVNLLSSLVRADAFFSIGGFNTNMSHAEDSDLCRRIALHGDYSRIPVAVGCVDLDPSASTKGGGQGKYPERKAREELLGKPNAFSRLVQSARQTRIHPAYWWGCLTRVYFGSSLWHLRRLRPFTALSRALCTCAVAVSAGRHAVSPTFWHAFVTRDDSWRFRSPELRATGPGRSDWSGH